MAARKAVFACLTSNCGAVGHYTRAKRILERAKLPMNGQDTWKRIIGMVRDAELSIVIGETGIGKTIQVPQLILDHAVMDRKDAYYNIICTQPRRMVALSIARRVAYERKEPLQDSVGHQIRHDGRLPDTPEALLVASRISC